MNNVNTQVAEQLINSLRKRSTVVAYSNFETYLKIIDIFIRIRNSITIMLGCVRYISACASIVTSLKRFVTLRGRRPCLKVSALECMRHHSVRKWKYIMRFEIRYFFLEIGLSPKGLTQS